MANSSARTVATAARVATVAEKIVDLFAEVQDILEYNSDQAIDWAAGELPAYIPEDGDGNIDGLQFSRQAVANAIGSMAEFRDFMTGQAVSAGDHLGNFNVVSQAD